jgi:hypothetical protein
MPRNHVLLLQHMHTPCVESTPRALTAAAAAALAVSTTEMAAWWFVPLRSLACS